jgi:hypothetical protein
MKKFIKKIFGIDKIEAAKAQSQAEADAAEKLAQQKLEELRLASLTPKERATENKEPYIEVMDTHVNKENVRNGFFELDWNEYFVLQLKQAGYVGDSEEAIVDKWFQDLCRNIGAEEGVDMERRGSGYINVNNLGNGKAEVS